MAPDTNMPVAKSEDDLRDIPKWAGRYAQNRTLRIVVALGIVLCSPLPTCSSHSGERCRNATCNPSQCCTQFPSCSGSG